MKFKNNPFFWAIIGFLAVWRITNIIQKEEIASPIRKAVGIYEPDGEDPDYWIYPDSFIGKVFHCFWCGSVWVAGIVTGLMFLFPPLILPFALSAAAISFKQWLEQDTPMYIENMWVGDDDSAAYSAEDDES
jgi:hypothetical protein